MKKSDKKKIYSVPIYGAKKASRLNVVLGCLGAIIGATVAIAVFTIIILNLLGMGLLFLAAHSF